MHALSLINRPDGKIAKTIAIFLDACFLISGFDDVDRRDAILHAMAMLATQRNVGSRDVCGLTDRKHVGIQLQRHLAGVEIQDQLLHPELSLPPLQSRFVLMVITVYVIEFADTINLCSAFKHAWVWHVNGRRRRGGAD
ncbi:hypothetical protein [Herbaspirillum autotrophicum]|uniref:hypothetical protein n=1 Tax=Herbaspirillum autotrophicum TaxID=180195 RepID=UPI0012ED0A38|nr:hypothetical protein [Herbaspirillum autotrophicum]